ncbi:hypothetical protein B0H10DRAFT_2104063, partial [Mycena sp. CBHHK59/15]
QLKFLLRLLLSGLLCADPSSSGGWKRRCYKGSRELSFNCNTKRSSPRSTPCSSTPSPSWLPAAPHSWSRCSRVCPDGSDSSQRRT